MRLALIENVFFSCVGDQVLEYNGVVLTGKTFEEVQRITSQPNGEIELVIKA